MGSAACSLIAIAGLLVASCSGSSPTSEEFPAGLSITPNSGYASISVPVVISGTGFLAKVSQPSGGGDPTLDTHHRAWLGNREISVSWRSTTTLDATVPADLGPGAYDLKVENALGNSGVLKDAYTVLAAPVFAGSASVDHPTVTVGQTLTLTFTVKNNASSDITRFSLGTPTISSTDGGSATPSGAAPSAPASIATGETLSFTWKYVASAPGSITIAVSATGVDASGKAVTAAPPAPIPVTIVHAAAGLTATAWSAAPMTAAVNQNIAVTLTLTNSAGAGAAAADVTAVVSSVSPAGTAASCTAASPAASEASPVSIADGQSATFQWTCKATAAGTYALNASITARDALTGADVAPALTDLSVTVNQPAPGAPTGLTATAMSRTRIDLSWNAVSGATSYVVLTSTTAGGPYTQIGNEQTATRFSHRGLSPGTTHFYVVQAKNAGGTSPNSNEVSATTPPTPPTPPDAPTGLVATAVSETEIDLTWNAVSGATGYVVSRGTATGVHDTQVGAPTQASFPDTGLAAGTTYFYVVQATNAGGTSGPSPEASATTQAPPQPVLGATSASQVSR